MGEPLRWEGVLKAMVPSTESFTGARNTSPSGMFSSPRT